MDNRKPFFLALLLAGLCAFLVLVQAVKAAPTQPGVSPSGYKISGPFTSGNLSVFLIHGKDQLKGADYLTLQEGLSQKKVVVHETGDVNQLSIDNLSNAVVFIQSGDIVKGGRQDRTMQSDLLVPPHAKSMAVPAFCVEQGRWSQRGSEADGQFAASPNAYSGKSLKMAAKVSQSQGAVWEKVAENQQKLAAQAKTELAALPSPSSYELTIEDKSVQSATDKMIKDLAKVTEGKADVIGYAFAINGSVNSADVYASNTLFNKLWPKLLRSSAVEALTERGGKATRIASEKDVRDCFADAEKAPAKPEYSHNTREVEVQSRESKQNLLFVTTDKASQVVVHKNYITK